MVEGADPGLCWGRTPGTRSTRLPGLFTSLLVKSGEVVYELLGS
jgi:hypothetical protein